MNLSRKWLSEFVTVDANDKDFAEAMTLSGSKVELTHDLGGETSNVVGVPDLCGPGGPHPDRHRGLERPCGRPGPCGPA